MKKNTEKVETGLVSELKKTDAFKVGTLIAALIFVLGLISKSVFHYSLPDLTLDDYLNHFFFSLSMSVISILFYVRVKNDKFNIWIDLFLYALILILGELLAGMFNGFELLNQEWHSFSEARGFSPGSILTAILFGIFSVNIEHFGWEAVILSTAVGLLGPWLLFTTIVEAINRLTTKAS